MTDNVSNFINFHNANIIDSTLTVDFDTLSSFATTKSIALEDLSIEKHRLPFINWLTGLASSHS